MNENKSKISALIITYNEVNHIDDVIKNISFADEIIVVDSFSNDGTLKKIEEFPHVKVIKREFKNFADQRNFAIEQANYEWVLFIDADERITPELKKEILNTVSSSTLIAGFLFKRKIFFNNKAINYSGFQTDTTYRLFKNGCVKYQEDKIVHEMPNIKGDSATLKSQMLHYSITDAQNYKNKMVHYAKLKALELFNKGKRANTFHFILRPPYKFITNYILRLGILDGKEGFQLCYLSAYGVYFRYCELKRLAKSFPK